MPGERFLYQKTPKIELGGTNGGTNGGTKTVKKNNIQYILLPKIGFKMAKKRYSRGDNTIYLSIKQQLQIA